MQNYVSLPLSRLLARPCAWYPASLWATKALIDGEKGNHGGYISANTLLLLKNEKSREGKKKKRK